MYTMNRNGEIITSLKLVKIKDLNFTNGLCLDLLATLKLFFVNPVFNHVDIIISHTFSDFSLIIKLKNLKIVVSNF